MLPVRLSSTESFPVIFTPPGHFKIKFEISYLFFAAFSARKNCLFYTLVYVDMKYDISIYYYRIDDRIFFLLRRHIRSALSTFRRYIVQ